MKKVIIGCICLTLFGCFGGPKFNNNPYDTIVELERSLSQVTMALSVAEMQYMLWTWSIRDSETEFSEADQAKMASRIKDLRETQLLMSKELQKRTK